MDRSSRALCLLAVGFLALGALAPTAAASVSFPNPKIVAVATHGDAWGLYQAIYSLIFGFPLAP